jgi:SWI/SNF-related matrix-associated actin-dependent regulator 1 of chromatin subfamily A
LEHGIQKSRQWVELQKVEPVVELISQELDDNAYDKIVIFCWHKSVMAELMHRLKRFHPTHIRGGMTEDARKVSRKAIPKRSAIRV